MRIIKEGSLREFIHTCETCGCVFLWDERDTISSSNGQYFAVECPWCHIRHDVSNDKPAPRGVIFVEAEKK